MHACIDLGSNSFHILIGRWVDGRIEIVERSSDSVQLGEDVRNTGSISPAAFKRGLSCLQHFKTLMDQYPLEQYWALGTNTFRVTDNAQDFILAARDIGIEISPISGVQEAVLIYAGVITSLPVLENHSLVIDIGGGSTEIIIGHKHSRLLTESMAVGSIAWRDKFFSPKTADLLLLNKQLDAATAASKSVFDSINIGVRKAGWDEAYASSGTVKMLATICKAHGLGKGEIELASLLTLRPQIITAIAGGGDLPGLKERRRELLLPGLAVLVGLMQSYAVDRINFSATALREGMLDFMVKNKKTLAVMQNSQLPEVSLTDNL
jgi:exopolyphosphatase / guanosine-5'-triphosphate,3'-diphosphate pyrophosphatase